MGEYLKQNGSKIWHGCLLSLIGALLGYGISQTTTVAAVARHDTEIVRFREDFNAEKTRTDTRIFTLVGLTEKMIEQNKEFIVLIRIQSELLRAKAP